VHAARPTVSSAVRRIADALCGVPILVSIAVGLLVGDATGAHGTAFPAAVLAALAAGAIALFLITPSALWIRVGVTLVALGIGNVAAYRVVRPRFPARHVAAAPMRVPIELEGIVTGDPDDGEERVRLIVDVERLADGAGWRQAEGRVSIHVHHATRMWMAGDRMRLSIALHRPRNFGNPGEFDYEGYLARRGIYVTAFADDDSGFARIGHAQSWLASLLSRWRRGVAALFHGTLRGLRAVSVALGAQSLAAADAQCAEACRRAVGRAGAPLRRHCR